MRYDFVPMPERKPLRWPNGKRLALMITLNLEYWELTQDHDGLGRGLLELFTEDFHCAAALLETIAADFDGNLVGEPRGALFEQRRVSHGPLRSPFSGLWTIPQSPQLERPQRRQGHFPELQSAP